MAVQHRKHDQVSGFAVQLLKTDGFRKFIDAVFSDVLTQWGRQGKVKSKLAKQARRIITSQLDQLCEQAGCIRTADFLQAPDSLVFIRSHLPFVIKSLTEGAVLFAESLEKATEDEQKAFTDELSAALDSEKSAELFSSILKLIDSLHKNNPTIFADTSVQLLGQFLKNIDFGEIQAIFENSETDLKHLGTRFNDLLFEYPAKLILFLALVPGCTNLTVFYLQDLLKRFNELPADILTDLLISFFRELDAESAGAFLNHLSEFFRQIHTGSALIGDAGTPQFSRELRQKSETVLRTVDMNNVFRAGRALIEGKEAFIREVTDAAGEDPNFAGLAAKHSMKKKNSRVRLLRQKFDLLDNLSEEKAAFVAADWLAEWNASEFAELVNSVCTTANLLYRHEPDALRHAAVECVNSLDLDEIEDSAKWISRELTQSLAPVIQTVVPIVVKDVVGSLENDNGYSSGQISEMRTVIRQFILKEEKNDE